MLDPSEVRSFIESARADVRQSVAEAGHSLSACADAMRGRDLSLDSLGEAIIREPGPGGRRIACRAGCAHCCHQLVATTPLEALRIAEAVRSWSSDRLDRLLDRLRKLGGIAPTRDARTSRKHPCPLLENNLCSVYDVRPGACQGLYSYSERACRKGLEKSTATSGDTGSVPSPDLPLFVGMAFAIGLEAGQIEQGLDTEPIDLVRGLLIALTTPDAAPRWLAGEEIFIPARVEAPLTSRDMVATILAECGIENAAPPAGSSAPSTTS